MLRAILKRKVINKFKTTRFYTREFSCPELQYELEKDYLCDNSHTELLGVEVFESEEDRRVGDSIRYNEKTGELDFYDYVSGENKKVIENFTGFSDKVRDRIFKRKLEEMLEDKYDLVSTIDALQQYIALYISKNGKMPDVKVYNGLSFLEDLVGKLED